jgi:hypothetical protein
VAPRWNVRAPGMQAASRRDATVNKAAGGMSLRVAAGWLVAPAQGAWAGAPCASA